MSRFALSAVRRAFPELRSFLDRMEDTPLVMQLVEDASRATVAERAKLCDELSAVEPMYKKRLAAATEAVIATDAAATAAAAAHRDAAAALRAAQGAAYGLERTRDSAKDRIERLLRDGAALVVRDAKVAISQHLSLNFHIPDLNSGIVFGDNEGLPVGWGKAPQQNDAKLLPEWHAAFRVQQEVLGALDALELQAISDADAAEAVTVLLRRLTAATAKIQAPGFELDPSGAVVRTNPVTRVVEVLTVRTPETAQ